MRFLFVIIALVTLSGCETIGDMVREKKYSVQINQTPNSVQTFGYNTDHDYLGFMMHGSFGRAQPKHVHSLYCKHNTENKSQ